MSLPMVEFGWNTKKSYAKPTVFSFTVFVQAPPEYPNGGIYFSGRLFVLVTLLFRSVKKAKEVLESRIPVSSQEMLHNLARLVVSCLVEMMPSSLPSLVQLCYPDLLDLCQVAKSILLS